MTNWEYGEAYKRHPLNEKQLAVFDNGSIVKVHDIFNPLPNFMKEADLIFVDPPWNGGNLNSFYTKADSNNYPASFDAFIVRLFKCIGEIDPITCYVEVGKEYLYKFIEEMKIMYKHVTFFNCTYYHRKKNICYVIRGSSKRKSLPLDYMDEEDVITWICQNEEYSCIGDLCMGLGLVGLNAFKAGKRFVGTELNHKRLAVLLEKLVQLGCTYKLEDFVQGSVQNKVGRPPMSDLEKRKNRSFKATDEEWLNLQQRAKATGMSVSKYIRERTLK